MLLTAKGSQTTAAKTVFGITGGTTVRPRVKNLKSWQVGTVSTDAQVEVLCQRITTAGTSTAVTPGDPDSGDPAANGITFGSNYSAEPTVTANSLFLTLSYNPRGKDEWNANDPSQDILIPATASNGIGALLNTLGGATTVYVQGTVQN